MKNALLALSLLFYGCLAQAGSMVHVQALLEEKEAPAGVVFEILEGKEGLTWAIPQVVRYSELLRQRFPDLSIAVVSHGREEFALQSKNREKYPALHQAVLSLSTEQAIPVHVCGTHAGWFNVNPEDFPDYVDVAPAGPTQIRDYEDLGYRLVRVERDQD